MYKLMQDYGNSLTSILKTPETNALANTSTAELKECKVSFEKHSPTYGKSYEGCQLPYNK